MSLNFSWALRVSALIWELRLFQLLQSLFQYLILQAQAFLLLHRFQARKSAWQLTTRQVAMPS
jgi:hypothetical protein